MVYFIFSPMLCSLPSYCGIMIDEDVGTFAMHSILMSEVSILMHGPFCGLLMHSQRNSFPLCLKDFAVQKLPYPL